MGPQRAGHVCATFTFFNGKLPYNTRSSAPRYDDLEGWDGGRAWERGPGGGGHVCVLIADSRCTVETSITLYTPIKNKINNTVSSTGKYFGRIYES